MAANPVGAPSAKMVRRRLARELIGPRILGRLATVGLRKSEIERRADLGHGQLYKYVELGFIPRTEKLARLASVLQTSASYLLGETENPNG